MSCNERACVWRCTTGLVVVFGRVLALASNAFIGGLPLDVYTLARLTALDLTLSGLTGTISDTLSALRNLRCVHLCGFCASQPFSNGCNALDFAWHSVLLLANNGFSGTVPSTLAAVAGLVAVDLSHNQFTGSLPSALGGLPQLTSLVRSSNNISGSVPSTLSSLSSLQLLDLSGNALSGSFPSLGTITTLAYVGSHGWTWGGGDKLKYAVQDDFDSLGVFVCGISRLHTQGCELVLERSQLDASRFDQLVDGATSLVVVEQWSDWNSVLWTVVVDAIDVRVNTALNSYATIASQSCLWILCICFAHAPARCNCATIVSLASCTHSLPCLRHG